MDLVLSDLPSGATCAEFDQAPDLPALFTATWHALKPDGVAVFMASSLRFAAACMAAGGKAYRYDLIWEKGKATGHLNARVRPLRAHEFVLVFSPGQGYFVPQMAAGAPMNGGQVAKAKRAEGENYGAYSADYSAPDRGGTTERYPRSVLRFPAVASNAKCRIHPQQKPVDLLRWLVRSYSRPGDLVIDPFAGSGSTGVAALAEGRRFAGFDSCPRFAPRSLSPLTTQESNP